ncbi:MAG: glutaredoxin family protein [Actinobacteria bacterium]|nr:glutaredoxin family protein [Actinomycetota bacterium]
MTSPAEVVMYSRRRCGLCDEARAVVLALAGRVLFTFEEVFIDGDDRLERDYGLRVPVITVDGEEAFEISVHSARLREVVLAARS